MRFTLSLWVGQVSLAEVARLIAGMLEQRAHAGEFLRVKRPHGFRPSRAEPRIGIVDLDACLGRITSREHGCARRHAQGVGAISASEEHAIRGHAIHVGSLDKAVADTAAQRFGEQVVGYEDEYVRTPR